MRPSAAKIREYIAGLPEPYSGIAGRLFEYFDKQPAGAEYDLSRLITVAKAPTRRSMTVPMVALAELGVVRPTVRVQSKGGGTILELNPGDDIPRKLHDRHIDRDVRLDPDDVVVVYTVQAAP